MSLYRKTLLLVGVTLAVLTLVLYLSSRMLIARSFTRLEEQEARQNLERVLVAYEAEKSSLLQFTYDYAAWTPTYDFVERPNEFFRQEGFPSAEHSRLGFYFVGLFDLAGRPLLVKTLDKRGVGGIPPGLEPYLDARGSILLPPDSLTGKSGLLVMPEAPCLVASWPVLTSDDRGPSRGTLVIVQKLEPSTFEAISTRVGLAVTAFRVGDRSAPQDVGDAIAELSRVSGTAPSWTTRVSPDEIAAFGLLRDLHGEPALVLRVAMPRVVSAHAKSTLFLLSGSALIGGLVFGGLVLILLERTILSRLKALGESIVAIGRGLHASGRVQVAGKDELAAVADNVNHMLSALETSQAELRASEERYSLALRASNDGIWDWDLASDSVYFSERWKGLLGHAEHEVGNSIEEWFSRVHPEDVEALRARIEPYRSGAAGMFEHECRMRHGSGGHRYMLFRGVPVTRPDGRVARVVGSMSDISDRRVAEERLMKEALFDNLTGLPNRTLFLDRLHQAAARAKRRQDQRFAVLFIDIDRFKVVNDSLGHLGGDQLLIAIGRRLEACVRPEDTVARLGGDEFVVLLEGLHGEGDATHMAERLGQEVRLPLRILEQEVFVSASIGVALSEPGGAGSEEVLREADIAMYHAKTDGRARFEVFRADMRQRTLAVLEVEHDLRRSVEKRELTLHYQPVVGLQSEEMVGVEALVRWPHPKKGLVSPAQFIPLAEETGLILPLGAFVLFDACRQAREWHDLFPEKQLRLGVNVSPRQLAEEDLVEVVESALSETGFPANQLRIEITESVLVREPDVVLRALRALKALGVIIVVDDFGTGYSSLSSLHLFPVDVLKLDGSFVRAIDTSSRNRQIVEAILLLANNLRIQVIAECIETEPQLEELRALGCHYGQGFLFSPPVEASAIAEIMARPAWLSRRQA